MLLYFVQAMGEIWGHGEHVQCTHPMAGCIAGREEVTLDFVDVESASATKLQQVMTHGTDFRLWRAGLWFCKA